ncbi:MAG: hypothetical protein IJZ74_00675 [Clostridia bacterium]|nr:hypothetical protein [Clostridia bacterium]
MKKLFLLFLALVLMCSAAVAETPPEAVNPVPDEILALFNGPAWVEYHIPRVTGMPEYYAFTHYVDASGYGAGLIILRKDDRNVLCLLEYLDGRWRVTGRNHEALPQSADVPYLYCEIYGQLEVYLSGEDDGTLFFCREGNAWYIDYVQRSADQLHAYVREDGIRYCFYERGAAEYYAACMVYGIYERGFEQFNWMYFPSTPEEAELRLTYAPIIPQNQDDPNALGTPVEINFRKGEKYDVFSAPGRDSYRPANGKAEMSTNDWVQVFGEEAGWLLVQYDVSSEQMRFGYIDASALPRNAPVRRLEWAAITYEALRETYLTDDPLYSRKPLIRIGANDEVTCLGTMGSWLYVETTAGGKTIRGFVPAADVAPVEPDEGWNILDPNG